MTGVAVFAAVFVAYDGGLLLGLKWNPEQLFILLIVPIFIAAVADWLKTAAIDRT